MRRLVVSVTVVLGLVAPGCAKNHASKEAFCRQLEKTPGLTEVFSGFGIDATPTLRRKMRDAAAEFSRLERTAPRTIRSSVGSLADAVDKIVETVNESPNDPGLIRYRLTRSFSTNAGASKAALKVAEYASRECKVDINSLLFQSSVPDSSVFGAPDPSSPDSPNFGELDPSSPTSTIAPFGTPP